MADHATAKMKPGHNGIIFSTDSQIVSLILEFSLPQTSFFKNEGKIYKFPDKERRRVPPTGTY